MINNNKYLTNQGNDCILICVFNYLNYYGLMLDESELFFLGEGFKIYYAKKLFDNQIRLAMVTDVYKAALTYCEENNISYNYYNSYFAECYAFQR